MARKIMFTISIICILLSLACWIPNIVLQTPGLYFLLTFPISVIGVLCAIKLKNKTLIVCNAIMFFSTPIIIWTASIFDWLFQQ
ncbi:hypothetical protein HB815_08725 [Listeria booriae]|uniref:hypothetical protein n=1 Tax=Listeria booriae TaxID=1552123 RepID=UPI00162601AB|nr:hypothetical protein [Listeria booriae]MBC1211014.1 hypothetical protein [Listeria booriae]